MSLKTRLTSLVTAVANKVEALKAWTVTELDDVYTTIQGVVDAIPTTTSELTNDSGFITSESDPKRVTDLSVTGTATKTITLTLADTTTVSGTFTDESSGSGSTYTGMTLTELNTGTETTERVIAANVLDDWLTGKSYATTGEIPDTIEAYITDLTAQGLLSDTSNWDVDGVYTGTSITGTFQGQRHYDTAYFFEAVGDNLWIRYPRV